jgi:hypothetical protein
MNRLSQTAALAYYESTREAYALGFISWGQVLHRLAFLYTLTDDSTLKKKLLFIAEDAIEEAVVPSENEDTELTIETAISPVDVPYCYPPFPEQFILKLIVKDVSGLSRWVFNQYDPDFFPSIPHGRENSGKRKLDAYLGWIYLNSTQVGREPRKLITALWNNDRFRVFALTSIRWYMASYPLFTWRVQQPLKIPRKRK